MKQKAQAALLVFLAAAAWGAEYVLPLPPVGDLNLVAIVFWGHILGLFVLLPLVHKQARRELPLLRPAHLPHLFAVAIGGEVLAGLVFSFSYGATGGAVAIFLLMLRPFFALAFAWFLLGEKRGGSFLSWAGWVFVGAAVILAFDPTASAETPPGFGKGLAFGLTAVMLWALATVSGKKLLFDLSPGTLVLLRWSLSLLGFAAGMLALGIPFSPGSLLSPGAAAALAVRALLVALPPLWIYYHGLKWLPAGLASFVELTCPLLLVFLPALLGNRAVADLQWLGGLSIVAGVALLLRLELEFEGRENKKLRHGR